MNRLQSCPLNETCQKTDDPFYRHKTDLKSCKNYWDCRVLSAAWKIPIFRHYDSWGAYWEVNTAPTISEWSAERTTYPSNISYCAIRFFTESDIEIGFWFDRALPVPLVEKDCLTLEEIVAMEIKITYYQMGFALAVPRSDRSLLSSVTEPSNWEWY